MANSEWPCQRASNTIECVPTNTTWAAALRDEPWVLLLDVLILRVCAGLYVLHYRYCPEMELTQNFMTGLRLQYLPNCDLSVGMLTYCYDWRSDVTSSTHRAPANHSLLDARNANAYPLSSHLPLLVRIPCWGRAMDKDTHGILLSRWQWVTTNAKDTASSISIILRMCRLAR